MPNTYTQLYIQLVFAVKGRKSMISADNRDVVEKYITAVLQKDGHKLLAIYCMPDHIHILTGINPAISIAAMVLDVKRSSTNFINREQLTGVPFNWQRGYGAFSYAKSQMEHVVSYILNQRQHHAKTSFRQEYIAFLKKFEIEYKDEFLFDFYE
jgi:putative transposase